MMDDADIVLRRVAGALAVRLDDGVVVIRSWNRTMRLKGGSAQAAQSVLSQIDGHRSIREVAESLELPLPQVVGVVEVLERHGIVEPRIEYSGPTADSGGAPGSVLVVGDGNAAQLLAERIGVAGILSRAVASVDALESAAPQTVEAGAAIALATTTVDYDLALRVDTYAARAGRPWMAAWWEGSRVVVTHLMRRGSTACFECLLQRQGANYLNREVDEAVEHELRAGTVPTHGVADPAPWIGVLLAGLLAFRLGLPRSLDEAAEFAVRRPDELMEFDLLTGETSWSRVLRAPWCPRCSTAELSS
jgi:bacteriocin biosynthesis cyclodehydratase domain-containing protein